MSFKVSAGDTAQKMIGAGRSEGNWMLTLGNSRRVKENMAASYIRISLVIHCHFFLTCSKILCNVKGKY